MRTIITFLFIGIISVGTLFAEEQVTEKKNENNSIPFKKHHDVA